VPASPSGKGEACIGDLFNFDFKDVGCTWWEREREKRKFGGVVRDTTVLEGSVIET
jgi:hypothetical protein